VVNWHVTVGTGTAVSLQAVKSAIEKGNEAAGNRGAVFTPAEIGGICRTHLCHCLIQWFAGLDQGHGKSAHERKSDASLSG